MMTDFNVILIFYFIKTIITQLHQIYNHILYVNFVKVMFFLSLEYNQS